MLLARDLREKPAPAFAIIRVSRFRPDQIATAMATNPVRRRSDPEHARSLAGSFAVRAMTGQCDRDPHAARRISNEFPPCRSDHHKRTSWQSAARTRRLGASGVRRFARIVHQAFTASLSARPATPTGTVLGR